MCLAETQDCPPQRPIAFPPYLLTAPKGHFSVTGEEWVTSASAFVVTVPSAQWVGVKGTTRKSQIRSSRRSAGRAAPGGVCARDVPPPGQVGRGAWWGQWLRQKLA